MSKKPAGSRPPPERHATIRSEIARALRGAALTARELSAAVGIGEKAVADHLEHIRRSLRSGAERLQVEPARCLDCDFVFRKRERLGKPSACPVCRGQHLSPARFSILPTRAARPGDREA
jgi:predicted Zn-ribbon and HTH transcriptional regulator